MPDLFRIQFVLVVGAMLSIFAGVDGFALTQSAWPGIAALKEVQLFDIGEQMTFNGLPMRVKGFVSAAKPTQLADGFRQSLGQPLVEDHLGDKLILGRAQGEHYLTVQLEPAGAGTRGLIAVTHLKAAYDRQRETQDAIDHRQSRLPPGSRVISQMSSEDGGKLAEHFVMINSQSMDLNLERMKDLLRDDGFELKHEANADGSLAPSSVDVIAGNKVLFFKATGKEATVVIYRKDSGGTTIVLNTVALKDRLK